jgi:hypothetical protein
MPKGTAMATSTTATTPANRLLRKTILFSPFHATPFFMIASSSCTRRCASLWFAPQFPARALPNIELVPYRGQRISESIVHILTSQ